MKKKFKTGTHTVGPGNYYGSLEIRYDDKSDQWMWSVENYDGHHWTPIPKYLAEALAKFNYGDK